MGQGPGLPGSTACSGKKREAERRGLQEGEDVSVLKMYGQCNRKAEG